MKLYQIATDNNYTSQVYDKELAEVIMTRYYPRVINGTPTLQYKLSIVNNTSYQCICHCPNIVVKKYNQQ